MKSIRKYGGKNLLKLHKLEKHHYYALIFIMGFIFGFISGKIVYGQTFEASIVQGVWYAIISTVFTIVGYEVGVKKGKR